MQCPRLLAINWILLDQVLYFILISSFSDNSRRQPLCRILLPRFIAAGKKKTSLLGAPFWPAVKRPHRKRVRESQPREPQQLLGPQHDGGQGGAGRDEAGLPHTVRGAGRPPEHRGTGGGGLIHLIAVSFCCLLKSTPFLSLLLSRAGHFRQ